MLMIFSLCIISVLLLLPMCLVAMAIYSNLLFPIILLLKLDQTCQYKESLTNSKFAILYNLP